MKNPRIGAALLSFFLFSSFTLPFPGKSSENFETCAVADIPWGKNIVLKSDLYQVSGNAMVTPDFDLIFSVQSQYGAYEPAGFRKLAVLLKEIDLIRILKSKASGSQVAEGAGNSVRDIGRGFTLLATHPVGTVKNVGRAGGEFLKKGGRLFSRKKRKTLKKPSLKQRLFEGARRSVANEFGADVYTGNEALNHELNRIAHGRMGGSAALAVARFFVPVTLIGSVALTASGVSSSADEMVNSKDPWELYDLNRKAFQGLGLKDKTIDRFLLGNPYFNPREQTRVRFYLNALSSSRGWQDVFNHFSRIKSEKDASRALTALEMLMAVAEKRKGFDEIGLHNSGLYAAAGKQLFVIWPYDFVFVNGKGEKLLETLGELKSRHPSSQIQVLNLGLASSLMRSRLKSLGVPATEGVFFKEELSDDEISRGADAASGAG